MTTTNKGLEQPIANSPNWNVPLDANFGVIDAALGGTTTKNVTGVGTTPVVLTLSEYQNLALNFTGTLSANVTYQVPSGVGGQWVVFNGTTGSYTLTIDNVASGASVAIPQGARRTVYSDGTNVYLADNSIATVGAAGNVAYSDGVGLTGSADFTYDASILKVNRESSAVDTALPSIRVSRSTSGTAAAGIGAAIQFATENASGSEVVGGLVSVVADDVTAASEDYRFVFQLVAGGASLATVAQITPTQISVGGNAVVTARSTANTATQDIQYAGIVATSDDDGTISSGTYTPTPVGGNFKRIVNGGAFTLAAPSEAGDYTMVIQMTNTTGAGAVTFSGFNKVSGDAVTTTSGHDFFIFITKVNGFESANVQALQ